MPVHLAIWSTAVLSRNVYHNWPLVEGWSAFAGYSWWIGHQQSDGGVAQQAVKKSHRSSHTWCTQPTTWNLGKHCRLQTIVHHESNNVTEPGPGFVGLQVRENWKKSGKDIFLKSRKMNHWCHQMSDFQAKMHQIRFPLRLCPRPRPTGCT